MKKLISLTLSLTLVFGLCSCGNYGGTPAVSNGDGSATTDPAPVNTDATYTINLGTTWANDHPVTLAIDNVFIPYITEHTNGDVAVNHMPNNQMGSERELYEAAISGQLDMVAIGNLLGNNMIPELNIQEIPFLWDDENEFWDTCGAIDSEFGVNAQEALDEIGVQLITLHKRGFRQTTSNKSLETLDDFQGLIIRMPDVKFIVDTWESFGTVPTIIGWNETYTALQQHTAEASEGSLDSLYAMKLYEVQDHLAMTSHVLSIGMFLSNQKYFNSLPEEYQDVILEAGALAQEEIYNTITENEANWVEDMEARGVTVTYPDRDAMREACKNVVIDYIEATDCAREVLEIFGKTDFLTSLGLEA